MRPNKQQIEEGIKSTGKYRQENGYSLTEHQSYVDGWYDAIEFMNRYNKNFKQCKYYDNDNCNSSDTKWNYCGGVCKYYEDREITEEELKNMPCKWYGAGHELRVGDKICDGFTINYANLNGTPPSEYRPNEISLSLKMFVEIDGILYELYKKI